MVFPNYFADAESDFDEADFVIFGVPYEKTSSFRHGADKAPREIRQSSWNFETYDLRTGVDLKDIKLHDYGDLDVKNLDTQKMVDKVKNFTSTLIVKNKFPIAIGGVHSISPGIINAFPNDIAVLSLDGHMDFRESYENDINNHACTLRRIADHIHIKNIAVIGIRSAEKEEFEDAQKAGLFFIDTFSIRKKGIHKAIEETKKYLKDKKIYLTLDMDVIDPAYASGTSTPEPFGLNPFDILELIDAFSSQLIGFDIVEVCPAYDLGETSILAAKLLRYVPGAVWSKN
ncbi:MAG: agmatinase [Thermoplasmatales archaeon]|nr:MAG: agmatinase [Thermoplasmatales archaeon]